MATQQGELRIRISAKDQASKKLGRLTGALKGLVAAYLSFRGVKAAISFIKDITHEAMMQEKAIAKLNQQLRNWGELTDENTNYLMGLASSLSKVTQFSEQQIIAGQAMLGSFALTADQIGKATSRMLDVAIMTESTTGQMSDLTAVAKMMGMAMDRNAGMLSRAGIVLSDYQRIQLNASTGMKKFNILMEIMDQNAKGLAKAVGETWAGQMMILNNQINDTKRILGETIVKGGAWKEMIVILNTEIDNLNKWLNDNRETVAGWGLTLATTTVNVAHFFSDSFHDIRLTILDVKEAFLDLRNIQSYVVVGGGYIREDVEKERAGLEKLRGEIGQTRTAWGGWLNDVETKLIAAHFRLAKSIGGGGGGGNGDGGGDDGGVAGSLNTLNNSLNESEFAVNKWAVELEGIVSGLEEKKINKVADALDNTTKTTSELQKETANFAQSWTSGVIDNIYRGQLAFEQFAKSFVRDMTKMIVKALIFKAITAAFGLKKGGSVGGVLSFLGLQHGGYVGGGAPYGDRVPAMLDPREFVMNPEATSRIGVDNLNRWNQGETYNNTFNLGGISITSGGSSTADARSIANELETILPEKFKEMKKRGKI